MCDASDYLVGAVLGQRINKLPHVIYYASRTLNDTQLNYSTTKKELLAVVFALYKFRSCLLGSKIIIYSLWVIRGGNLVCDEVLLHPLLKNPVVEMCTSITNNCSRRTKMSKYSVFQNFDHNSVVVGLACNCFHPLGHIVHSNQNVQKPKGV
jgi:hypothetical protein